MKYTYYMGCQVTTHLPNYDLSTRKVAEKLGITLIDLIEAGCCGCVIRALNPDTWLAMSARVITMAEKTKLDLVTLCSGCYTTLTEAQTILNEKPQLKEKINNILSHEGMTYDGGLKVKHILPVLYFDYGYEKIKSAITRRLDGLRVAVHYGCHLHRTPAYEKYDDPEAPQILDKLVEATGAESIYWPLKLWCCGGMTLDENLSFKLGGIKIRDAKEAGAHCIVTACPFCQIQFDFHQPVIYRRIGEKYDLPVLAFSQLLGLAMGIREDQLGLQLNCIPVDSVIHALKSKS